MSVDEEGKRFLERNNKIGIPFEEKIISEKSIDTLYSFIFFQAGFIDQFKVVPEDLEFTKSHLVYLPMPHPRVVAWKGRKWLEKYWKNIRTQICESISSTSGTIASQAISVSLGSIISSSLPVPYNESIVITSLITNVIVQAGIKTICDPDNDEPPKGEYTSKNTEGPS